MKELDAVDDSIFTELFLASPVASYICNRTGHIVAFNEASALLWWWRPEIGEAKWSGAVALYDPGGRAIPAEESPMAMVLEGKENAADMELITVRADGTRRHVLVFPTPIRSSEGHLIGGHNTLVDITDYKQYEERQEILSEIVQ